MLIPQTGIFALGDSSQIYLELNLLPGASARDLVEAVANFHEPRSTVGGVNLVVGFKPELWRDVAPADCPADAQSFDQPLCGPDGFEMPATQGDLWLWFSGASYDICWENARDAVRYLHSLVQTVSETGGWSYRHSRDLTGFEDGTENPNLLEAPDAAIVPAGKPGEGASILLYQLWRHEESWLKLSDDRQEKAMGRTKPDSIEFEEKEMPQDAHVARAKDVIDGTEQKIFRRNVPYGNVREYGTVFVGFSCEQRRLARMLARMAGIEDGIRDAITRYTTPVSGAYYVIPSVPALRRFSSDSRCLEGAPAGYVSAMDSAPNTEAVLLTGLYDDSRREELALALIPILSGQATTIDFTNVEHIDVAALMSLVPALESRCAEGKPFIHALGMNTDVHHSLKRAGLAPYFRLQETTQTV